MILTPEAKVRVRKLIDEDELAADIFNSVKASADKTLGEPPSVYELPDGRRLLTISARVMNRVQDLAFVYHMTDDKRYAKRAWKELEAASKFKDWNPDHFLDTAVMTRAFGVGYDWLWHELTAQQRMVLREAIVNKGIAPFLERIEQGRRKSWWHTTPINWNQICNGGIGMGALAIAGEEPELAKKVLGKVLTQLPNSMRSYAPDGASAEGAGYWAFAVRHGMDFLASMQSSLGTDFGLAEVEAYAASGYYHMFFSGRERRSFEFGDARPKPCSTPQHFWMAQRFKIPHFAWYRHQALKEGQAGTIHDLFWFDGTVRKSDLDDLPLDKHFRRIECASMRDSWDDKSGFIIGLQGGHNDWTHRHRDLGTYILDHDGVRWIVDLGQEAQTYHLLKSEWKREDYYRARAEAHNTLVINPGKNPGQAEKGRGQFTSFQSTSTKAKAIMDMSSAYAGQAEKVIRTYELHRGERFTVTDDLILNEPSELWSFIHTAAKVSLAQDRRSAILSRKGKQLKVHLEQPADAVFALQPSKPGDESPAPPKQSPNDGKQALVVRMDKVKEANIRISFTPTNTSK